MFKDKNNVWILCLKDKVMLRRNKAIVAQNDTTLLSTNCYCSSHKLFISEQLFWHVCNMFQECWKFFALFAATATTPLYNVYIVIQRESFKSNLCGLQRFFNQKQLDILWKCLQTSFSCNRSFQFKIVPVFNPPNLWFLLKAIAKYFKIILSLNLYNLSVH